MTLVNSVIYKKFKINRAILKMVGISSYSISFERSSTLSPNTFNPANNPALASGNINFERSPIKDFIADSDARGRFSLMTSCLFKKDKAGGPCSCHDFH